MCSEENRDNDSYPSLLERAALPVTHNHMIGEIQGVSLDNIRGTVALIRRLVRETGGHGLRLSGDETIGLETILENTIGALSFEQYHRTR